MIIEKGKDGIVPQTKMERMFFMALIHFDQEGFDKALGGSEPMLVDFWAEWCGPCRMLGPVIEQLADEYEGQGVIIGKVNVDEESELARRYGVMSIPTVILLKNGEEIDRKVGVMPMDTYTEVLDSVLEQNA